MGYFTLRNLQYKGGLSEAVFKFPFLRSGSYFQNKHGQFVLFAAKNSQQQQQPCSIKSNLCWH